MPTNWELKNVGAVCHLVKEQYKPNKNESIPYIGLEHIEQRTLRLNSIGKSSDTISNKFKFKKGQVLFGKLRPYFRKLYRPTFDGVCSTDIFVIDAEKDNDNAFIFYFFANPKMIEEASRPAEGTRMPRASWEYLANLELAFPKEPEQKAIAKILSDLDSKVETNIEINRKLEEIGRILFQQWFVDFEFPNKDGRPYKSSGGEMIESEIGLIPAEWSIGTMTELVVQTKKTILPTTSPDTLFYHYSIPNFDNYKTPLAQKGSQILSNKFIVNNNSILVSKLNPETPRIWPLINAVEPSIASTEFLTFMTKKSFSYTYFLFTSQMIKELMKGLVTGTSKSHQRVKPEDVLALPVILPKKEVLDQFDSLTKNIIPFMESLSQECVSLSNIRDTLLPKLMSGQIRVPVGVKNV